MKPIAKVVSAHGDPEAFGEREIEVLVDLKDIPYGTILYMVEPDPPEGMTYCPECSGKGFVDEDYLDDSLVSEVTNEYCQVFNKDYGYGVESYEEYTNNLVYVKVDTTCRSCYSSETYKIPRAYFTRNKEARADLMLADQIEFEIAEKQKDRERKQVALKVAEADAQRLREELENV